MAAPMVAIDNGAINNMVMARHISKYQDDVVQAHKERRQKSINVAKTSSLQISAFVIGVLVNRLSSMEAWSTGWGPFVFGLVGLAVWQLILRPAFYSLFAYLSDQEWMLSIERLNIVIVVTLVVVIVSAGGGIVFDQALQTNQTFFESISELTVYFIIVSVIAFTAGSASEVTFESDPVFTNWLASFRTQEKKRAWYGHPI